MSTAKQRLIYTPLKHLADALIRVLTRVVPPLQAAERYAVALPVDTRYALPLNFKQLSATSQQQYKNIFYPAVAGIFILKNVHVSWQGAVFYNFSVFSPTLHPGTESEYHDTFLLKQWLSKAATLPPSQTTIALAYNQYSSINYYHWIIETLPRLLVLREKYPDCLLLVPPAAPEYIRTSAAAFGFTRLFEFEKEAILQVPELIIPYATPSHWGLPFGYEEGGVMNEIRREVLAYLRIPASPPTRRLYISRSRAGVRRLLNEEAVQRLVAAHGFETVYFEGMSFREQVALMQQAAVILGVHGANLANLVFMQPGTKVIEIMSEEINNLTYYRLATYLSIGFYSLPYEIVPAEGVGRLFADVIADTTKLQEILGSL